ncbi:hypothetical protein A2982_00305 [candidate division WWE3 bacterium RIFCSPLOWO2_01_FULL_39_13]|uniref:Glutamyl-tRNA amidotransferase n=1 Tax=candidate division WWE3 bacterium RIFCSPLOWO2_01_FULL_39_13 TaxID=1802624 RepID=A0A1F4V4G4_UNCKA|nr:MAG: hypothetical protein A2982_00305 [candidate division WWE3 bacterium RIFCSPLOWO2_01_FULL_39_13]
MILERLKEDLTKAMFERDLKKANAIRLLLAEFQNAEIALYPQGKTLDETAKTAILSREHKKRKESAEIYEKAGRLELLEQEKYEISIIGQYLPSQLSDEEIEGAVKQIISEMTSSRKTPLNFGAVMSASMAKLKGKAEGKKVSEIVKRLTSGTSS